MVKIGEEITCYGCGASIPAPKVGEFWWCTYTGELYKITSPPTTGRNFWSAQRVRPKEGADVGYTIAMFGSAVREGKFKRAEAESMEAKLEACP